MNFSDVYWLFARNDENSQLNLCWESRAMPRGSQLIMISLKQMLKIICTDAVEFGGLPEVPGQQHGGRTSFHAAKRPARRPEKSSYSRPTTSFPTVKYSLRIIKKADGSIEWRH